MKNREFERLQKKQLKKEIKVKIKEAKLSAQKPTRKIGKKKKIKLPKKEENKNDAKIPTHMSSRQIEKMTRRIIRQHKDQQDEPEFEHVG